MLTFSSIVQFRRLTPICAWHTHCYALAKLLTCRCLCGSIPKVKSLWEPSSGGFVPSISISIPSDIQWTCISDIICNSEGKLLLCTSIGHPFRCISDVCLLPKMVTRCISGSFDKNRIYTGRCAKLGMYYQKPKLKKCMNTFCTLSRWCELWITARTTAIKPYTLYHPGKLRQKLRTPVEAFPRA